MRTLLFFPLFVFLLGCSPARSPVLQGYAEGDFVRVAAPYAGALTQLGVKRGEMVEAGTSLYVLEQENEKAQRSEAEAGLKSAKSRLANLEKGKRPSELDALRAQRSEAEAALKLSRAQYKRDQDLVARNFISQQRLDETRSAVSRDESRVAEIVAQLKTAELGARVDEIAAARAEVRAAQAAVAQAQWRLEQKSIKAPVAGLVQDTLYVVGEWVPAGSPVVSILPATNIKVRFFLPEQDLSRIKVGQDVKVGCDGCPALRAQVSYIAPQAEYTPPVIYSVGSRAKLVYLAEARLAPADAVKLHPGQPLDITLP